MAFRRFVWVLIPVLARSSCWMERGKPINQKIIKTKNFVAELRSHIRNVYEGLGPDNMVDLYDNFPVFEDSQSINEFHQEIIRDVMAKPAPVPSVRRVTFRRRVGASASSSSIDDEDTSVEEQLADVGAVEPTEFEESSSADDDEMSATGAVYSHCSGDTCAGPYGSKLSVL